MTPPLPAPPAAPRRGPFVWLSRLPWWLRAPLGTAVVLVAIVLVRALSRMKSAADLADAAASLGVVALAGLVAGGVPTALWLPLRRLGYVGSLLLGLVGAESYMLCCSWGFGKLPKDTKDWSLLLGLGAGFGLLIGHRIVHPVNVARAKAVSRR